MPGAGWCEPFPKLKALQRRSLFTARSMAHACVSARICCAAFDCCLPNMPSIHLHYACYMHCPKGLNSVGAPVQAAAEALLQLAHAQRSRDDVSVVLLHVQP